METIGKFNIYRPMIFSNQIGQDEDDADYYVWR